MLFMYRISKKIKNPDIACVRTSVKSTADKRLLICFEAGLTKSVFFLTNKKTLCFFLYIFLMLQTCFK